MDYIFKPMSYVLVILLGYLLKRAGFFGQDDHRMMSKIMVNITLPCTIVQAFDGFERGAGMFVIVGIGLLCAFVPILLMYLTTGGVESACARIACSTSAATTSAVSRCRWCRRFSATRALWPPACSTRATRL